MKKLLVAAAVLCMVYASCKKDPEPGPAATTSRKDTLTTGKWMITAIKAQGKNPISQKDTTVDFFASFDSCAKDDYYIFLSTGKMNVDQSTAKCDMTGPQQREDGSWSLNSGRDTLIMADGTLPGRFKITSFSNTSMQLVADTVIAAILPVKLTATFSHQ